MKRLRVNTKNEKVREFIDSNIFSLFTKDEYPVLAGGAVRSFIDNEDPRDFDLFIISQLGSDNGLKAKLVEFLNSKYEKVFECPQGFLYSYKTPFGKLQLITPRIYKSIEELLGTFDLSPCLAAFDGRYVHLDKPFIRSVKKKICTIQKVTYPIATMSRLYKYRGYGYNIFQAQNEFISAVVNHEFEEANAFVHYID